MPASAQRYPFLPVANSPRGIFAMMQDSTSRLWLGTIDNLFSFDGVRFFPMRPYGYPRETANGFAEDDSGGIWIGTQGTAANGGTQHGGLYRYADGHVTRVFAGDCLSIVRAGPGMMVASFGTELVGKPAYGKVYLFQKRDGEWRPTPISGFTANHFTISHDQRDILFPCPGGWCEVSRDQLEHAKDKIAGPKQHQGSQLIERVLKDRFGCMWFRAEAFASYQCPGMDAPLTIPDTISQTDNSAHLEEALDGSVFMLVKMALGRPGHFKIATGRNGIPPNLDSALIGRDGTIWLGTDSGLLRFPYPFQLEYWDSNSGLESASSVVQVGGRIYASSDGIIRVLAEDRERWVPWGKSDALGAVAKLGVGPSGSLLAASRYGIAQLDASGLILARAAIQSPEPSFVALATGDHGQVWFGNAGLSQVKGKGSEFRLFLEPLASNGIRDMQYDPARSVLWACDGKDLLAGKLGHWRRLTTADGLMDANCGSIALEKNGGLWLGYDTPAYAFIPNPLSEHPAITNFDAALEDVKSSNGTHFLGVDKQGWVWRNAQIQFVADAKSAQINHWLPLLPTDGVPEGGGTNAFWADSDGSVWIFGGDRLIHLSLPASFVDDFRPPPVFISGFGIGQGPPSPAEAAQPIPFGKALVAFLGSLQFDRRGAMKFRHRLLPDEPNWKEQNDTQITLPKLSWGNHRLEVQARMATGAWSTVTARSFQVLKPLWLMPPVLLGEFVVGSLALVGTARWRRKLLARRKKLFPDITELRVKALSPELEGTDGLLLDKRYELGRVLARGGFATVLEARDLRQKSRECAVAVKVFRHESADQDWLRRRFRQEVEVLEQITHPNVLRIYGHGTTPAGAPYIVMEFIAGRTVREILREGPLSRRAVASYIRQLAGALKALHSANVIHRDLKPENIMIRDEAKPGEELVLIDFSLAIVKDPDQTIHGLSRAAGTVRYMAPEQNIGYADSASDIYSLSRVIVEMLTGRELAELLPDASIDLPVRIRDFLAEGGFGFRSVSIAMMSRALQFHPSDRPNDAEQFVEEIASDLDI